MWPPRRKWQSILRPLTLIHLKDAIIDYVLMSDHTQFSNTCGWYVKQDTNFPILSYGQGIFALGWVQVRYILTLKHNQKGNYKIYYCFVYQLIWEVPYACILFLLSEKNYFRPWAMIPVYTFLSFCSRGRLL